MTRDRRPVRSKRSSASLHSEAVLLPVHQRGLVAPVRQPCIAVRRPPPDAMKRRSAAASRQSERVLNTRAPVVHRSAARQPSVQYRYVAMQNSRIFSKICLKAGSGARHMVRYVSRKGSHSVRSLYRTSECRKCSRHFRTLARKNQSLRGEISADRGLIGSFWRAVSGGEFSISERCSQRPGSRVVETGSHVRFRLDCVAKVESCRSTNFSRKHETGNNR